MKTIKTTELTANKKFKALVKENVKGIKEVYKRHVAGIGYVTYLKDEAGNSLAKFFRDTQGMTLYID